MEKQKILNNFKEILRANNLKFTPQRFSILEEVLSNNDHRECENIYDSLKAKGKEISRATIYRTLEILVQGNFLRKIELGDCKARYESKINNPHHDHLICNSCGNILEFMDPEIERLQEKVAKEFQFKITKHIHQIFGLCKSCNS